MSMFYDQIYTGNIKIIALLIHVTLYLLSLD